MGLASQPIAAASRARCKRLLVRGGELVRRAAGRRVRIGGQQALDGFDERRQRGFGVGGDGEIHFRVALEVLIIASWCRDRRH